MLWNQCSRAAPHPSSSQTKPRIQAVKILTILHNAQLQIFNQLFLMGHTTHRGYQISSIKLIDTGRRRETELPESTKENKKNHSITGDNYHLTWLCQWGMGGGWPHCGDPAPGCGSSEEKFEGKEAEGEATKLPLLLLLCGIKMWTGSL